MNVDHNAMNTAQDLMVPRSTNPPTAMAQTVASKTSWNSLNKMAGMVPTGEERTSRWKRWAVQEPKNQPFPGP